ncbi:MAG TPA: peptidoglycan DD-metalloendopeptidase family protein [Thermoanaerobaculia bacterium]|nr:peptidoglycan DD-metalloendopeptidase family protein [Thermoanaerobaculia bacterium]
MAKLHFCVLLVAAVLMGSPVHAEPDGSRKVLRTVRSDAAGLAAVWTRDMEVRLIDLDGKVARTIARAASPAFSPDGGRLAYAKPPKEWQPGEYPGGFDLHVLDLATGDDSELTAGYDDAEPVWTPDGRHILFLSGGRTGLTSFWRIDARGGEPRQVTNAGRTSAAGEFVPNPSANVEASWSKDGRTLLYGSLALRFDRSWNAVEALVLDRGVQKSIAVGKGPSPERSEWRPGRDVKFLAGTPGPAVEKHHTNPPYFRYPLPFHPNGPRYYYDHNRNVNWIASWKCNGETYDNHTGSDFPAPCGTAIVAAQHGYVFSRNDGCPNVGFFGNTCGGGYGNYVAIDHGYGWISIYGHMQAGTPVGNISVGCGQYIGTSYSSGSSTGCHLHFEVQLNGFHGDPYAGPCSGTASLWCNQNGDGAGFPGRICC